MAQKQHVAQGETLVSATRNRKHPPLTEHVNSCSECLLWVMDYMVNVAKTIEKRFH